MELIDKNPQTGATESRMRGIIWANNFARLRFTFEQATSQEFRSGIKVMVCGSVNYHASYGMSFVITNIDASYTLGEAERLRREILLRLKKEGVLQLNKQLPLETIPLRIAVISAKGAAGYGDFINQLYNNGRRLRFTTRLFPAVLQGERTAPTVIAALDRIAADADAWDCVVIIRGGGATTDLAAFDNYELANNVAQFPLPVVVGIGHERDITVLDYVAFMRVKTPTAAAEWLISLADEALDRLHRLCSDIIAAAQDRISGAQTRLAYLESLLPVVPLNATERAVNRLSRAASALATTSSTRIATAISRLDARSEALGIAATHALETANQRINATSRLIDALSPLATLRRGYSMTRINGHAVTSANQAVPGTVIETIVADGSFTSSVN